MSLLRLVLSAAALTVVTASIMEAQNPAGAGNPERVEFIGSSLNRPLAEAVRVGNTIYLSGALGTVPGQGLVQGGIEPETRQTMENIKASLERLGSHMDDVVKCTVFLADMAEWGAMNRVYTTYFTKHRPARSAVGVNGLAINARVEVECIAVIGARNAG